MKFSRRAVVTSLAYYSSFAIHTTVLRTTRAFVTPAAHHHKLLSRRPSFFFATMSTTTTTTAAAAASTTASPTTTTTTTNPLLQQEDLPKFSKIQPQDLSPAVEELLTKMESDFSQMEQELASASASASSSTTIQYEMVLPALEKIQFPLGYTWGVAGHLNGVKNSDALRQVYEANQPKIVQAFSKFQQSKPVYDALLAIEEQWKKQKEEQEEGKTTDFDGDDDDDFVLSQRRRAVENSLRAMKLGGVGLEGEAKERFNEIKMRLASLGTTFSNNVLDETKAFALTIDDASKMEGVPESAKAMWASAHVAYLKQQQQQQQDEASKKKDDGGNNSSIGSTAEEVPETPMDPEKGPWRITLDMPSYVAVMSHMKDRAIREQVYKTFITRASEKNPSKNNIPLIYETLKLKQEQATMLGFQNYAELSLAKKMAPNVEAVRELTDLIAEKALPAAEKELEEIFALAKEQGGDEYVALEKLEPWDITFWSERLKESKFDLTEEETRPYFALPAVLDGMFSLVSRIFDIEVKKADGEAEVWNKDVSFFKVFDKSSGKHIASFYLDPYSRPEDKRGGAWMDVCIGKSEAVKREIPVAYLTCNGSPPVGSKPSLMTFREVETLFHEFGHGLQHMLTTVKEGDVAGINGIEWDAVELPSQFMENWCYDRPTVYGFAKHWETGEPMPEEMFEKLKEQKTFNAGMMTCRQLLFGQVDMELHAGYDAVKGELGEGETIFDVFRRVAAKYTPYNMPLSDDRFLCAFSHIFAGGYAAGYYSYKWAEVMSADAFSAFEDVGLDNEEEVKKVGMRFRQTVLSLGGGKDPMTVFKSFRGREPSPEALLRHNGLS